MQGKMFKRWTALSLAAIMTLTAISCGGTENGGKPQEDQTTENKGGSNMKYNSSSYSELFSSPTAEYRLHSMYHGAVDQYKTGLSQFISNLSNRIGQGGLVTNISFGENGEYLDAPDAFTDLNAAAKIIKSKGYKLWLYDEIGYPSGAAGGRTALDNPEYVSQGLVLVKRTGSGKNPVTVQRDKEFISIHAAYAVDGRGNVHQADITDTAVSFGGVESDWTLYIAAVKRFYEGTHAQTNGYGESKWVSPYYINIMNNDAVGEFINNTYRAYAEKFEYFSEVTGIFTDEPSLMEAYVHTGDRVFDYAQLSWTEGFDEAFEEMHGYSIKDKYHLVFDGMTEEAMVVRTNYRQTVGKLVSESYFGQIADFCEENGTRSSGHALLEERVVAHAYYYGDLLQCLRQMSIPGVDSLYGKEKMFMHPDWPGFMAMKYASSATTLEGKDRMTMVELCFTDCDGFPMSEENKDSLFKTVNTMAFLGITHYNCYVPLNQLGDRQRLFSDYLARLSYMSRNAVWVGNVGLYYPINTFQAYSVPSHTQEMKTPKYLSSISNTALELFANQQDFTVADNQFILEASIENGRIFTENVSFSVICMPGVEVLPLEVAKKLDEFEKSGGTVIWVDCLPTVGDSLGESEELKALLEGKTVMNYREAGLAAKEANPDPLKIKRETPTLYVGRYTVEDAPMYWLYNSHDLEKSLTLTYKGARGFDIYDPETGEITFVEGESAAVNIKSLYTKLVVVRLK